MLEGTLWGVVIVAVGKKNISLNDQVTNLIAEVFLE